MVAKNSAALAANNEKIAVIDRRRTEISEVLTAATRGTGKATQEETEATVGLNRELKYLNKERQDLVDQNNAYTDSNNTLEESIKTLSAEAQELYEKKSVCRTGKGISGIFGKELRRPGGSGRQCVRSNFRFYGGRD